MTLTWGTDEQTMRDALERDDPPAFEEISEPEWLPALEQELKRRVGWADEAVSPFARKERDRMRPLPRAA